MANKNSPIEYNDPNGDCPTCPKIESKASVSFTFGTKNQSRLSFAAGFGVSHINEKGNFMSAANLSINLYTGGPGTRQAVTGKSALGGAATLGLSATLGSGSGSGIPTSLNIFNSTSLSGVTNSFEKSATLGTNLTFNTATGFNRAWGVAGKYKGFTTTLNEDFSLLKHGILASGKDEGETGGGFMGLTTKNGTSIYLGTEIFTGKPTNYPKYTGPKGFVYQNKKQQQLNVGRTFLIIENSKDIVDLRFDYSGQSQMWSQNLIHDTFGFKRFESSAANSFQVTLTK